MTSKDFDDINGRLQRCLTTPSISSVDSKRCFTNPDMFLSEIYETLKATQSTLCICFRKQECKCSSTEGCMCDSDECFDVSEVKFASHSNCRYSIELMTTVRVRPPPKGCILRLFALDKNKVETPILDIASNNWSTKKQKKDEDISFGHVCVYNANHVGLKFELIDYVRLDERSTLISFDYMSFTTPSTSKTAETV